jgi:hypothetical protein
MNASALLAHQKTFNAFLKKTSYQLSSFAFVNIFSWKDFFQFDLKVMEGALCIFAKHSLGTFLYLPPLGKPLSLAFSEKCFDFLFKVNRGRGISRIENVEEKDLGLFSPERYTIYKKSDEFVYRRCEIAQLSGNKYKSKRALYNQCVRQHRCVFAPYTTGMKKECLSLYAAWAQERKIKHQDTIYQQMIDENYRVHDICLTYMQKLGLVGRVVLINDKVQAYTVGFPLKKDTFCILLEVADMQVRGLPTYVFKEFCADPALRKFDLINVMDDFGLENIRATKLSFKPCAIYPSYVVSRKA